MMRGLELAPRVLHMLSGCVPHDCSDGGSRLEVGEAKAERLLTADWTAAWEVA